ncbi:MAG: hypothetical protein IPK60_12420 [Sandaracinaceae bacterium]|jgi:hypothetical protein|nr:hypothetical protein [Sandaracinaceae bacterium]
MHKVLLVSVVAFCAACGPQIAQSGSTAATAPTTAQIEQRLEVRLTQDPNRAMCDEIVAGFRAGNADAAKPHFDFAAFVERVVSSPTVPEALRARLRANPSGPQEFGRVHTPPGWQFRCLGTRALRGEDYLAIRLWGPTKFSYLMFHLSGPRAARRIDDYYSVDTGIVNSTAQQFGFDPQFAEASIRIGEMYQLSYEHNFTAIIQSFRQLPGAIQNEPVAFGHFVNAVYASEQTGSVLYNEATNRMRQVYGDNIYTLAYWELADGNRRGDRAAATRARDRLIELLDDAELLGAVR